MVVCCRIYFFASEASYHWRPSSESNRRWPRYECILTTSLARKLNYFWFVSNHRLNCSKMRLHKSNFEFFFNFFDSKCFNSFFFS